MDHRIETRCETNEEQRDAVLHHLLNGICVLRPDVPSCNHLSHRLLSTMHLSYDICSLLLSAYKHKKLNLNVFRLCCASLNMRTDGSNPGRDLSSQLQQHLTRWGPLYSCENAVDMIACIESFGFGSLLELASLHGIRSDMSSSEKDCLCDIIVNHLVFGECQTMNAVLCTSICSTLLLPNKPNEICNLRPLILDAVIKLGTKKTL